jgi:hypothetical protein
LRISKSEAFTAASVRTSLLTKQLSIRQLFCRTALVLSVRSGKLQRLITRFSFFDLVNVSEDTKTNEQDVDSDMVSIAMDIIAQLNYAAWDDWKISTENSLDLIFSEGDNDMYGGCTINFSISIMFKQNICAIPSEVFKEANTDDLQIISDLIIIGLGTEGLTLSPQELTGKRVLFIKRGDTPIYKVSNNPAVGEFTWDGSVITLGAPVNTDERFLILYSGNL